MLQAIEDQGNAMPFSSRSHSNPEVPWVHRQTNGRSLSIDVAFRPNILFRGTLRDYCSTFYILKGHNQESFNYIEKKS